MNQSALQDCKSPSDSDFPLGSLQSCGKYPVPSKCKSIKANSDYGSDMYSNSCTL